MTPQDPIAPRSNRTGARAAISLVYIVAMLVLSMATLLTVWPTSTDVPSWLVTLSTELRYLLVVASGSALGTTLRAILAVSGEIETGRRGPQSLLRHFLSFLWAVPLSLVCYLVLRGVLLSPTASTANFNPFGLLLSGFLVGLFADAALDRLNEVSRALAPPNPHLEERMSRIADALGVTTLDNYRGEICVSVVDGAGETILIGGVNRPTLGSNRQYELTAWFQEAPSLEGVATQEIRITGGSEAERVDFLVAPDSDADISFVPRQQVFSFDPREPSLRSVFAFVTPVRETPYRLWVRVTQKTRLVAVLAFDVYPDEST